MEWLPEWPSKTLMPEILRITDVISQVSASFFRDFKTLSFKHEATPLTAFLGSCAALGSLELFESIGAHDHLLIGSFAALATLLFSAPAAPLGTPWNTLNGHAVSVIIAVSVHWLQILSGVHLYARVTAPSLSIAIMMHLRVTNPPAAATAFLFITTPEALAQPMWGLAYLVTPALTGSLVCLAVQWSLAHGLALYKARAKPLPPPEAPLRPKAPPVVTVDMVDPIVATIIANAVEGAHYVRPGEELTYLISTLAAEQSRIERQLRVLHMLGVKGVRKDHQTLDEAATRLQRWVRRTASVARVIAVVRRASLTDSRAQVLLQQLQEDASTQLV